MKIPDHQQEYYRSLPTVEIGGYEEWEKLEKWYIETYGDPKSYVEHPPVLEKGKIDFSFLDTKLSTPSSPIQIETMIFLDKGDHIFYTFLGEGQKLFKVVCGKDGSYSDPTLMVGGYRKVDLTANDPTTREMEKMVYSFCIRHQMIMWYMGEYQDKQVIYRSKANQDNTGQQSQPARSNGGQKSITVSNTHKVYVYQDPDSNQATRDYRRKTDVWLVRGHWRDYGDSKTWIPPHLRGPAKDKHEIKDGKIYKINP